MKKSMIGAIVIVLLFSIIVTAEEPLKFYVNGHRMEQEEEPVYFIDGDRTYVQLRRLSEELGFKVTYDSKTREIVIKTGNGKLSLYPNQREIRTGTGIVKMDVPPILRNDRTYLPIRYFAQAVNEKIQWDGGSRSVYFGERLNEDEIAAIYGVYYQADGIPFHADLEDYTVLDVYEDRKYIYKDIDFLFKDQNTGEGASFNFTLAEPKDGRPVIEVYATGEIRDWDRTPIHVEEIGGN